MSKKAYVVLGGDGEIFEVIIANCEEDAREVLRTLVMEEGDEHDFDLEETKVYEREDESEVVSKSKSKSKSKLFLRTAIIPCKMDGQTHRAIDEEEMKRLDKAADELCMSLY